MWRDHSKMAVRDRVGADCQPAARRLPGGKGAKGRAAEAKRTGRPTRFSPLGARQPGEICFFCQRALSLNSRRDWACACSCCEQSRLAAILQTQRRQATTNAERQRDQLPTPSCDRREVRSRRAAAVTTRSQAVVSRRLTVPRKTTGSSHSRDLVLMAQHGSPRCRIAASASVL